MAKETASKTTQEPVVENPIKEPEYEAKEIAQNARSLFGYSPDLATAALRMENIQNCTLSKAKSIIKAFAERKVN